MSHRGACSYSFGLDKPSHIVVTKEKDELTTKKKTISGSIPPYSIDSNCRSVVRARLAAAYMKHTKLLYSARSCNNSFQKFLRNLLIKDKHKKEIWLFCKKVKGQKSASSHDLKILCWHRRFGDCGTLLLTAARQNHQNDLCVQQSKKINSDQELIQSDSTSCPQNQMGNN